MPGKSWKRGDEALDKNSGARHICLRISATSRDYRAPRIGGGSMSRLHSMRFSYRYSHAVALAVAGLTLLARAARATDVLLKSTATPDLSLPANWVGNAT